jgi:hypothetical protein
MKGDVYFINPSFVSVAFVNGLEFIREFVGRDVACVKHRCDETGNGVLRS